MRVVGVNAGHAFSFVRDAAEELRWAAVPAEGSQFRSRDLFPQAAAAIALGQPDALGEAIDPGDDPRRAGGPGRLRRRLRQPQDDAARGDMPSRAGGGGGPGPGRRRGAGGGRQRRHFAVAPGQVALAPGSSGWPVARRREMRWMELFLRGGNAWEAFGRPAIGDRVEVEVVE